MTNTKTFGGAFVLLILIAALDNFIFIEQVPGYEGMMLIDARDAETALKPEPANQQAPQLPSNQRFWIDREQVNAEEFARFIAATHYQTQTSSGALNVASAQPASAKSLIHNGESAADVAKAAHAEAEITSGATSEHAELLVQAADARAYCNWLGKELPTEEQFEVLAEVSDSEVAQNIEQEGLASEGISQDYFSSFRCVKNLNLSQN